MSPAQTGVDRDGRRQHAVWTCLRWYIHKDVALIFSRYSSITPGFKSSCYFFFFKSCVNFLGEKKLFPVVFLLNETSDFQVNFIKDSSLGEIAVLEGGRGGVCVCVCSYLWLGETERKTCTRI